jgi:hypothetical protein
MHADDEAMPRPAASERMKGGRADRPVVWTDEDLVRLHGHLLEKSLHDLFDARVSVATRREILAWLRAPKERSNAFSYRTCCALFGLDADEIRERVLAHHAQCAHR